MDQITVVIGEASHLQRLDKALAIELPEYSRARLQDFIQSGDVVFKGKAVTSPKQKVQLGQSYIVNIPPPINATPDAENIPLDIVYEDEDLLVINKQPDMVVHPAAGHADGTLVNALLHHCGNDLSGIGGVRRPGIVHRLDKETSGLMIVAKNDHAHQHLSAQLKDRSLSRIYQAFVWGVPSPRNGIVETQIGRDSRDRKKRAVVYSGGKDAVTEYNILKQFGTLASLVECKLQTGRTHQIRVHMAHIQHWMIGDPAYGRPYLEKFLRGRIRLTEEIAKELQKFPRQALHAAEIGFIHPRSEEEMHFTADMPDDMQGLQDLLLSMNVSKIR